MAKIRKIGLKPILFKLSSSGRSFSGRNKGKVSLSSRKQKDYQTFKDFKTQRSSSWSAMAPIQRERRQWMDYKTYKG